MSHSAITIVGAGLGGLTLARVLHQHGIEAAVYDRDPSPTAREEGGMVDVYEESGQAALRAAGLFGEFERVVQPSREAVRILDKDASVRWEDDGDHRTRPEVGRRMLRSILLASLPEGMIRWRAGVTRARTLVDGRHEVQFTDGSTVTTDLLVGADGAWSKVRPLVSAASPVYSGVSFIEAYLVDADEFHRSSADLVGPGSMFALADGKGFLAHRDADGGLHVYIALTTPADWATSGEVDFTDPDTSRAALLRHFDGWATSLLTIIATTDGPLIPRPIYAMPVGHSWPRVPGVTLIGDAAHLVSPFIGVGANLAMLDGAELGTSIALHRGDIEAALAAYERELFPRSAAAAAESAATLAASFRADAPQGLLDRMAALSR
jgi:2-polyprenyl-6-methoxyphenol hydroxylase-like FAD-dependent oxidoreductase